MASQQEVANAIKQLQDQQSLLTRALRASLEGEWFGTATSVEAYLYALDPNMENAFELDTPVTQSQYQDQPPKV